MTGVVSVSNEALNVEPEQTQYWVLIPMSGSSGWKEQEMKEVGTGAGVVVAVPVMVILPVGMVYGNGVPAIVL